MARQKTFPIHLGDLRKAFKDNKGKVLSVKQVAAAVKKSYWRHCLRDLREVEGMNIESIREGRTVVGYKYVDGGQAPATVKVGTVTQKGKVAATITAPAEEAVAASKPKTTKKPKKATKKVKGEVNIVKAVGETPAGEEDPDVIAVLQAAGFDTE